MNTLRAPAFYVLAPGGTWRDYVNLLHAPYTLWLLSYVVIGAAIAPSIHVDRLLGTLLAFFLAVGIGSHALDELDGRPLKTRILARNLAVIAALSLGIAVVLGAVAAATITVWLLPFIVFGAAIAVAYNLGLWGRRFHSDFWFAFAWGAFPVLTSYWVSALKFDISVVLVAGACFTLSLAQRALSTQVRTFRRKTAAVIGTVQMKDGTVLDLDGPAIVLPPERALRLLCLTVVVLATGLVAYRL